MTQADVERSSMEDVVVADRLQSLRQTLGGDAGVDDPSICRVGSRLPRMAFKRSRGTCAVPGLSCLARRDLENSEVSGCCDVPGAALSSSRALVSQDQVLRGGSALSPAELLRSWACPDSLFFSLSLSLSLSLQGALRTTSSPSSSRAVRPPVGSSCSASPRGRMSSGTPRIVSAARSRAA